MHWKQLLTSIAGSVDEELRLRNAYLTMENRILRHQITGRVPRTNAARTTLAELGQKLGKKALAEVATCAAQHHPRLASSARGPASWHLAAHVCWTSPYRSGDRGFDSADGPRESLVGL
jgi:hypothetical protein